MVIYQATINNTMQGVGTSVMSGFHGHVDKNEMLWQIFLSNLEEGFKNPLRYRSENDTKGQPFRLKTEQNKKI